MVAGWLASFMLVCLLAGWLAAWLGERLAVCVGLLASLCFSCINSWLAGTPNIFHLGVTLMTMVQNGFHLDLCIILLPLTKQCW